MISFVWFVILLDKVANVDFPLPETPIESLPAWSSLWRAWIQVSLQLR